MTLRVVFDTATVVSALLFEKGHLSWLRRHWAEGGCLPLVSRATAEELTRMLAYSKFQLSAREREEILSEYLLYCETVRRVSGCPIVGRDPADQPFLDLAHSARVEVLVTGDKDLLVLAGRTRFTIETPAVYRQRFPGLPL
jgi:putative PIN family toxin of toxin-antitoxin system